MKISVSKLKMLDKFAGKNKHIIVKVVNEWLSWYKSDTDGYVILTNETGDEKRVKVDSIEEIHEGVAIIDKIEDKIRTIVKEEINEDSVSPSYRRMLNALGNVIPMVFPNSKPGMDSPIFKFQQLVAQGKPDAQKEWPKVKKYIDKMFKDINLKKIKDEKELLKVLDKTAKGMKV